MDGPRVVVPPALLLSAIGLQGDTAAPDIRKGMIYIARVHHLDPGPLAALDHFPLNLRQSQLQGRVACPGNILDAASVEVLATAVMIIAAIVTEAEVQGEAEVRIAVSMLFPSRFPFRIMCVHSRLSSYGNQQSYLCENEIAYGIQKNGHHPIYIAARLL